MRKAISILFVGLVVLAGCQPQGKLRVPGQFVELDGSQARPYTSRAVSADGVVLALRTEANPKNGTQEFWAKAISEKMTEAKGYRVISSEAITSRSGRTGTKLHLVRRIKGVDYTYLMAVYVAGQKVEIVEAGGKTADVTPLMEELGKSLQSL